MVCQGTHDPMRPITNYVRVIDLTAPESRHTGGTTNIGAGEFHNGGAGNVLSAGHTATGRPVATMGELARALHHALGILNGAAENNASVGKRRVAGTNYTVLTWSPAIEAPSGKNYVINGYVTANNMVERVRLGGRQHHGDMHVVATYTGWRTSAASPPRRRSRRHVVGGRSSKRM